MIVKVIFSKKTGLPVKEYSVRLYDDKEEMLVLELSDGSRVAINKKYVILYMT